MIIQNEKLLDTFREPGTCTWCRRSCLKREPHHLQRRGMAGGHRLDIPCNIAPLCSSCHDRTEKGLITREDMLAMVAQREGVRSDTIEQVLLFFNMLDKDIPSCLWALKATQVLEGEALCYAGQLIEEMP